MRTLKGRWVDPVPADHEVDAGGAVPLAFRSSSPIRGPITGLNGPTKPGINPTAGLAGLLYLLDFDHPWREEAARFCWRTMDDEALPDGVHALSELLVFLESFLAGPEPRNTRQPCSSA